MTNPDGFVADVTANGTPETVARREVETGDSVLLQPVDTVAVGRALAGETGVDTALDYVGAESLVAYAPLKIPGLDWAIVAFDGKRLNWNFFGLHLCREKFRSPRCCDPRCNAAGERGSERNARQDLN